MSPRSHGTGAAAGGLPFRLPTPRHHSGHEVVFDGSVLGTYTMSIYPGNTGPVMVLEEGPESDLSIEFLSVPVTEQVLEVLRDRSLRVFERHRRDSGEVWVEVEISDRHNGEVHIARTAETGAERVMEALGTATLGGAVTGRRRATEDQGPEPGAESKPAPGPSSPAHTDSRTPLSRSRQAPKISLD